MLNLSPGFSSPPYPGLPPMVGFGGMSNGTNFGIGPLQAVLSQTMSALTQVMSTLMSGMAQMSPMSLMMGGGGFGTSPIGSLGSPLNNFLGGLKSSAGSGGAKGSKAKPNGTRIPGGMSLYNKRGMFHKGAPGAPNTYAFENSPAGIKFAAKNNYASIDIDLQITKDGIPVATHWSEPLKKDGFYDPMGKIKKGAKVSEMTLAEVMRLRNKDGQSRIYPITTIVKELKKNGIAGNFEAKDDPRFATDKVMGYIADVVRDSGIKANMKSISRGARTYKLLKKAQEHGFWARVALPKKGEKQNLGYA